MGASGITSSEKTEFAMTLDAIVVAFCADYERRRRALAERSVGKRVAMEYRYINSRIFEAAAEITGDKWAERYIIEIGKRIGYSHSAVGYLSEMAYKDCKRQIKLNIARKLHLVD